MSTETRIDALIIAEDPATLALLQDAFERGGFGHRLHMANGWPEALDLLFGRGDHAHRAPAEPPKLVLVAVDGAGVAALQPLAQLRSEPSTCHIPVVVLGPPAREADVERCHQAGINSYVVRPSSAGELERTVALIASYWLRVNRIPRN